MTSRWMVCALAGIVLLPFGCSSSDCTPGSESCVCNEGQCLADLACLSNTCVEPGGTGGSGGEGGAAGEGGSGGEGGAAGDGGQGGGGGAAGDGGQGGGGGASFPLLDPIAAWSFSGNAMDETGNGNDGTVQGAMLTDDRFGNPEFAYSFDGDDTIEIGNNVKPSFPFTFNVWIRIAEYANRGIMSNDDANAAGNTWGAAFFVSDSGKLYASVYSGFSNQGTRRDVATEENVLLLDEWQMATVVFASLLDTRIYLNGVNREVFSSGGTGNSLIYSSAPGTIGVGSRNGPWSPFQGEIDDVSVFDRALNDEEIQTLYGDFTTQTP